MNYYNNPELKALTEKFLNDFVDLSNQIDARKSEAGYHLHMKLPYYIVQCLPELDYSTLLMGMAAFDNNVAKAMFKQRLQGFVARIEDRLAYVQNGGEQDDYYIKNIKEVNTTYTQRNYLKNNSTEIPAKEIVFDVENSRSGFKGSVKLTKHLKTVFFDGDNPTEDFFIDKISFYIKGERSPVMSINYRFNYDTRAFEEEGEFWNYRYIADINSFYQTISAVGCYFE